MKLKHIVAAMAAVFATGAFAGGDSYQRQSGDSSWGAPQRVSVQTESPQVVSEVQRELNARGYDAGPANGQVNARTERSVKQFQASNNLSATGEIDQPTIVALGIGSGPASSSFPDDDPYRGGSPFDSHAPRD